MSTLISRAISNYVNPGCSSIGDLREDIKICSRIKRVLTKWKRQKILRSPRMLVNDVIIVRNVFRYPFCDELIKEVTGPAVRRELNTLLVCMRLSLDFINVDKELYDIISKAIEK